MGKMRRSDSACRLKSLSLCMVNIILSSFMFWWRSQSEVKIVLTSEFLQRLNRVLLVSLQLCSGQSAEHSDGLWDCPARPTPVENFGVGENFIPLFILFQKREIPFPSQMGQYNTSGWSPVTFLLGREANLIGEEPESHRAMIFPRTMVIELKS